MNDILSASHDLFSAFSSNLFMILASSAVAGLVAIMTAGRKS